MDELKKKTEAMLRAVLISSPRGVALRRLDREYKSITFSSIPYQEMGCPTLEDYIKSIPHVATLTRDVDGELVVKGVASESDKHVAKLIAKQKKPKKRSKPGAKSARRPTFGSFGSRPVYTRPVFVGSYRPVVAVTGARPMVAVTGARPVVAVSAARQVVRPSTVNANIKPLSSSASRGFAGNRFVPPRMMKQAVNKATAQRGLQQNPAASVERGVARQVEQQAQQMAAANNRKVTMVTHQGIRCMYLLQVKSVSGWISIQPRLNVYPVFNKDKQTVTQHKANLS